MLRGWFILGCQVNCPLDNCPPDKLPPDNCPPDKSHLGQLPTRIIATQSTAPFGQLPPRKIGPWTIADSGQLHITGRIPICYTTILQYVLYRKTLEQQSRRRNHRRIDCRKALANRFLLLPDDPGEVEMFALGQYVDDAA